MPFDVLGEALSDYFEGRYSEDIITYSSLDEEDAMPLPHLFRNFDEMPFLEQKALEYCKGNVLDIGCGAGSHSLWLQKKGNTVTGLDASGLAIEVCKKRGVGSTVESAILDFNEECFDTLLLLMNGIGIAGKLNKLEAFLSHLKKLMLPNAQILLDSSDIIYMFDKDEDGGRWIPGLLDYYGEVKFQMQYKGKKGPVFEWLYIDQITLADYATKCGFKTELLVQGEHFDYLARLTQT